MILFEFVKIGKKYKMFEYIIHFYESYKIIFYLLLIIWVIFEGPIIILSLSLVSPILKISFLEVLFFAFLWDFLWDLLHFLFARFFKNKIKKDFWIILKLEKKLEKHSLFDKLLVIKYTPPISSLGLLYLWYSKLKLKDFIKNDIILNIFSAVLISSIWYFFWKYFVDTNNFVYFIMWLFFSFVVFYFLFKFIRNYLIKKIYDS